MRLPGLAEIRDIRGEGALNEILDSHLLPNEDGEGLFEDDYEDFVFNRLELMNRSDRSSD